MTGPESLERLDQLMDDPGLDVLLVTSKHCLRYLFEGYECHFFQHMDAIGISRYLPVLVYEKGEPDAAHYVGWAGEGWDLEAHPIWVPSIEAASFTSVDSAHRVVERLRLRSLHGARIGAELSFLPADAMEHLRRELPSATFVDATPLLETLRLRKSTAELKLVEKCSVSIVDSMIETFAAAKPGDSKKDIVEQLRIAQTSRGITYEYCLIAMGANPNRGVSDQVWQAGEVLSLDSGGQYKGYVGDVARMAVLGEPDRELVSLLDQVHRVQERARSAARPGSTGDDIFAAARSAVREQGAAEWMSFVAHGMGLISHEGPRLTSTGPVKYAATHDNAPLEPGMVLSVEAWIDHPTRGLIKIEDTLAITDDGCEAFGDHGRGWHVAGI